MKEQINIDATINSGDVVKELSEISKGLEQVSVMGNLSAISLKGVSDALGSVGKKINVIDMFKRSLSGAFGELDSAERLRKSLVQMTGDADLTARVMKQLETSTLGTAFGMETVSESVRQFIRSGTAIGAVTEEVALWGNAVSYYGDGSNQQFRAVTAAIADMRLRGGASLEHLEILYNSGIDAVGIYAAATGMSAQRVQSALLAGRIGAADFIGVVSGAMEQGADRVGGTASVVQGTAVSWAGSFDRMKNVAVAGTAKIVQAMGKNLQKAMAAVTNSMQNGLEAAVKLGSFFSKLLVPIVVGVCKNLKVLTATLALAGTGFAIYKTVDAFSKATKAAGGIILNIDKYSKDYYKTLLQKTTALQLNAAATTRGYKIDQAGYIVKADGTRLLKEETNELMKQTGTMSGNTVAMLASIKVNGLFTTAKKAATMALHSFNAALNANPLGVILMTIGAAIAAVSTLTRVFRSFGNAADKQKEKIAALSEKHNELQTELDQTRSELSEVNNSIKELKAKGKLSLVDASELKKLEMTKKELGQICVIQQKQAQLAAQEIEKEALKAQEKTVKVLEKTVSTYAAATDARGMLHDISFDERILINIGYYQELEEQLKELEKDYETNAESIAFNKKRMEQLDEQILEDTINLQDLRGTLVEGSDAYDEYAGKLDAAIDGACEFYSAMLDADGALEGMNGSLESASFTMTSLQKNALDGLIDKYREVSDTVLSLFDTIEQKEAVSAEQMTNNLKNSRETYTKFVDGLDELSERHLDSCGTVLNEGIIEQLREAGPEYEATIEALKKASNEELLQLNEEFERCGNSINGIIATGWGADESTMDAVSRIVDSTSTTLSQGIKDAEFDKIGEGVIEGYVKGIEENIEGSKEAVINVAEAADEAARNGFQINSPSKVFEEIGMYVAQGLAAGIDENTSGVTDTVTAMVSKIETGTKGDFTTLAQNLSDPFRNIPDEISKALQPAVGILKSWLQTLTTTMKSGADKLGTTLLASFRKIPAGIETALKPAVQKVGAWGIQLNTAGTGAGRGFQSAVEGALRPVPGAVQKAIAPAVQAVKSWGGELKTAGKSAGSALKDGVLSAVKSLPNQMKDCGVQMINGLIRGIESRQSSLYAVMRKTAKEAVKAAKKELDIRSPSRVFEREVGGMMMEGWLRATSEGGQRLVAEIADTASGASRAAAQAAGSVNRELDAVWWEALSGDAGIEITLRMDEWEDFLRRLGQKLHTTLEDAAGRLLPSIRYPHLAGCHGTVPSAQLPAHTTQNNQKTIHIEQVTWNNPQDIRKTMEEIGFLSRREGKRLSAL